MNILKNKKTLYLSVSALLFAVSIGGCGSSDSSTPAAAVTVGTVSGSYYEGANVCFDVNGDGSCTGESTLTLSDSQGDFSLTGAANYPIIAEIPEGSKKHAVIGDVGVDINATTKTVFAIPTIAIAQAKQDGGNKVILSSISTRLYSYTQQNTGADIDAAMTAVAAIVGVDKADLLKDFNSDTVTESLRISLIEKSDTLLEAMEGQDTLAGVEAIANALVGSLTLPSNIDVVSAR